MAMVEREKIPFSSNARRSLMREIRRVVSATVCVGVLRVLSGSVGHGDAAHIAHYRK